MKVPRITVSALVVYLLVWAAPVYAAQNAAQNDTAPSSGNPPVTVQPAPKDTPAQPQAPADGAAAAPAAGAKTNPPPAPAGKKPAAGATEAKKRYVIGPLDVLDIKVYGQNQISGPVAVGPDGTISLSLVGEIKADGLTQVQLREAIEERLKECCLNNPEGRVEVSVAKINSKKYYVYGGVLHGGEFQLVETTTIMDALSLVGGFKDFAKPNKIVIHRGDKTFNFNYKDFIKGRNMDKNVNIELENGDRIVVPE